MRVSSSSQMWSPVGRENNNKKLCTLGPFGKEVRRSCLLLWVSWGWVSFSVLLPCIKKPKGNLKSWPNEVVIVTPILYVSNWPSDTLWRLMYWPNSHSLQVTKSVLLGYTFKKRGSRMGHQSKNYRKGTGIRVNWPRNRSGSHCLQRGFNFSQVSRTSKQTWWEQ